MTTQIDYDTAKKQCKTLDDIVGKGGLIQTMLKDTIQEMLESEMTEHLGYPKHHPAGQLTGNNRNGKSTKQLKTSAGTTDITIPRDRNGDFDPQIVRKYETSSNELEDKIVSMYAKGMTTRDITAHLRDLYGIDASPTLISNITDKVLELVTTWQSRLLETVYPIVYLDAIHCKVRDDGAVKTKAAYLVLGINQEGRKDILGIWIDESEGANFWTGVLTDLRNRGVADIFICCVDGLKGFPEAIEAVFPQTQIQSCIIHQIRNSLKYLASKDQKAFLADLKTVYTAPTREQAEQNLEKLADVWGQKYPLVIRSWQANWERLSTFFQYAPEIRRLIYTTNTLEGFNRQLRKVTKNRSVFPTDESLRKLLWLATNDIMKKWTKPVPNWGMMISQFSIHFPDRLTIPL
jgi:putative transposase